METTKTVCSLKMTAGICRDVAVTRLLLKCLRHLKVGLKHREGHTNRDMLSPACDFCFTSVTETHKMGQRTEKKFILSLPPPPIFFSKCKLLQLQLLSQYLLLHFAHTLSPL